MLHPAIELKIVDRRIGYGVFAFERIPRGTITWVRDPLDQMLDAGRLQALGPSMTSLLERYTWQTRSGARILCWDFARLMNHSCAPNTAGRSRFDLELAIRDIEAGEEITCDYAALNLERPFRCRCGAAACRGEVRPQELERLAPEWDLLIRNALPAIPSVGQPLWPWIWRPGKLLRAADAPELAGSTLERRWPGRARQECGPIAHAGSARNP